MTKAKFLLRAFGTGAAGFVLGAAVGYMLFTFAYTIHGFDGLGPLVHPMEFPNGASQREAYAGVGVVLGLFGAFAAIFTTIDPDEWA